MKDVAYKIAELKISCQLYKNSKSEILQQENKEIFLHKNQKNSLTNDNFGINANTNTNDFLQSDIEMNSENQQNQYNQNQNNNSENVTVMNNKLQHQQLDELNYDELKMDFEDILVLHLKVSHLVPMVKKNYKNYKKIFTIILLI